MLLLNARDEAVTIRHGERSAQLLVAPVAQASFVLVVGLDRTARGVGGFGSTRRGP